MEILNLYQAAKHFIDKCCDSQARVSSYKMGERSPIAAIIKWNSITYFVMRKDRWFEKFSFIYPRVKEKGYGQSFQLTLMQEASGIANSMLVAVMTNGSIYGVPAFPALDYVMNNNTFRIPSTEVTEQGSIPIRMMSNLVR